MIDLNDARAVLESAGLEHGLGLAEIHKRLQTGLRLGDTGQRILAFYLTEIDEVGLHQDSGHSSTVHYAEDLLGLNHRRTGELLAVGRKLLTLEAIDLAFCRQEIGWSKVLLLCTVVIPEHEAAWLERARKCTCRELAHQVRLVKRGKPPPKPGTGKGLPEIRFKINAEVGTVTHRKLELSREKLGADLGRPVSDRKWLDAMADVFLSLEEDGTAPGRTRIPGSLFRIVLREDGPGGPVSIEDDLGLIPLEACGALQGDCLRCDAERVPLGDGKDGAKDGAKDVETPAWLRARILARDGFRCRCCRSRFGLMVHHVRFRRHGGPTRPDNLAVLCGRCHALVHDGLLFLEGEDARSLRFLDASGRALNEPGGLVAKEAVLPLERVPYLTDKALEMAGSRAPDVRQTTLEEVPEVVDGG